MKCLINNVPVWRDEYRNFEMTGDFETQPGFIDTHLRAIPQLAGKAGVYSEVAESFFMKGKAHNETREGCM